MTSSTARILLRRPGLVPVAFVLLFIALLAPPSWGAESCTPFEWATPRPGPVGYGDIIATADGRLVAVGGGGLVTTSRDGGENWSSDQGPSGADFVGVAVGEPGLVAVGYTVLSGYPAVLAFRDANGWTETTIDEPWGIELRAVAYGGNPGRFVAVGSDGWIFDSTDGLTWNRQQLDAGSWSPWWLDVAWNGEEFLAAGSDRQIAKSPDGLHWTVQDTWVGGDSQAWWRCLWTGFGWVLLGDGGIASSANGVDWGWFPFPEGYFSGSSTKDIAWTSSRFLVAGLSPEIPETGVLLASPDGAEWVRVATPEGFLVDRLALLGTRVAGAGNLGQLATSDDSGASWESRQVGEFTVIADVETGAGRFVAVGPPGPGLYGEAASILTSDDGWLWRPTKLDPLLGLQSVVWNGSSWLATAVDSARSGLVTFTSPDGESWTRHDVQLSGQLGRPVWDGSRWAALGGEGVAVSTDGISWESWPLGLVPTPEGFVPAGRTLAWNGVRWLLLTTEGTLLTSESLATSTWTLRANAPRNTYQAYLASSPEGSLFLYWAYQDARWKRLWSTDGRQWSEGAIDLASEGWFEDLRWTGGRFVLAGSGEFWESVDGASWTLTIAPGSGGVAAISGGKTVVASSGGLLLRKCGDSSAPLAADFAWQPIRPTVGERVEFSDRSTGMPNIWKLDFGDGTTIEGTGGFPVHSFASAGVHAVTLTVFRGTESALVTKEIEVVAGAAPVAAFDVAPATPVAGASVTFTDRSTGGADSRSWSFGDGTSSTEASPQHVFAPPGLYLVTLEVRNDFGATTASRLLRVVSPSVDCGEWEWITPPTHGANLDDVAFGAGRFVAVGQERRSVVSPDGLAWTGGELPASVGEYPIPGIGTDGSRFLAVSDETIASSSDGLAWQSIATIPGGRLEGVGFGHGLWIAVGDGIWTSPDGIAWTKRLESGESVLWHRVAWNGSRFVAVGGADFFVYGGTGWVATSVDGLSWSAQKLSDGDRFRGVASDGARWLVAGGAWHKWSGTTNSVWTSPDGVAWTAASPLPSKFVPAAVLPNRGGFLVAGDSRQLWWTPDGGSWSPVALPPSGTIQALASGGGRLVAAGFGGTLLASGDGVAWSESSVGSTVGLEAIAVDTGGGARVAVGEGGILASVDGDVWSAPVVDPDLHLHGIARGGGIFVAVGRYGGSSGTGIERSSDGFAWNRVSVPTEGVLQGVAWTGRSFVAVATGEALTSPDGLVWTQHPLDPDFGPLAVASSGGVTVAVGAYGRFARSLDDGESWTLGDSGSANHLRAVAWGGGRFVALGDSGSALTSPDGLAWSWHSLPIAAAPLAVAWTGSGFVAIAAVADGSSRYVSPDGESWIADAPALPADFWFSSYPARAGLAVDGGRLLVTGGAGTVVRSACGPPAPSPLEAPNIAVIPAAAHAAGLGGTLWRSDVELHAASAPTPPRLHFLPRGVDGREAPGVTYPEIALDNSVRIGDAVGRLATGEAAGALVVASDAPLVVSSRTYNDSPSGTFGQLVPSFPPSEAITAGGSASLIGLEKSSRRRTNVGLVNLASIPVEATLDVVASDGSPLGSKRVMVPSVSSIQENDLLGGLGVSEAVAARVVVRPVTTGALVLAYASVVDNGTGDPVLVLPAKTIAGTTWLPGAAHAAGANGTLWRTDVAFWNPATTSATARLEYVLRGEGGTTTPYGSDLEIPPGAAEVRSDVCALAPGESAGLVRIVPASAPLACWAETWNETAAGALGQSIDPFGDGDAIAPGEELRLVGLEEDALYRTNLGLANLAAGAADAEVEVFDGWANRLGSRTIALPPLGNLQLDQAIRTITGFERQDAWIRVRCATPGGKLLAWGSVVDNRSGDPVFVRGVKR